jgi:hypothetical protein
VFAFGYFLVLQQHSIAQCTCTVPSQWKSLQTSEGKALYSLGQRLCSGRGTEAEVVATLKKLDNQHQSGITSSQAAFDHDQRLLSLPNQSFMAFFCSENVGTQLFRTQARILSTQRTFESVNRISQLRREAQNPKNVPGMQAFMNMERSIATREVEGDHFDTHVSQDVKQSISRERGTGAAKRQLDMFIRQQELARLPASQRPAVSAQTFLHYGLHQAYKAGISTYRSWGAQSADLLLRLSQWINAAQDATVEMQSLISKQTGGEATHPNPKAPSPDPVNFLFSETAEEPATDTIDVLQQMETSLVLFDLIDGSGSVLELADLNRTTDQRDIWLTTNALPCSLCDSLLAVTVRK